MPEQKTPRLTQRILCKSVFSKAKKKSYEKLLEASQVEKFLKVAFNFPLQVKKDNIF